MLKFNLGDLVRKTKGSSWSGRVVGTYSTSLTPEGYAVESMNEPGSVQIYPASALELQLDPRPEPDPAKPRLLTVEEVESAYKAHAMWSRVTDRLNAILQGPRP